MTTAEMNLSTRRFMTASAMVALAAVLIGVATALYVDMPAPVSAAATADEAVYVAPDDSDRPVVDAQPETAG